MAEGVLGGAHFPPPVDAVATSGLERLKSMVCRFGTTVSAASAAFRVSLDGASILCDVFYVLYCGLQAVWLFEMFERTPILFQ